MIGPEGEKVLVIDHERYWEDTDTIERYALRIGREFGLSPYSILNTWSYDEIYRTYSYIIVCDEEEEKAYERAKRRGR